MKAINIEWDIDNEEEIENLPSEIEIPDKINNDEDISDYITETTGFCHRGYKLIK